MQGWDWPNSSGDPHEVPQIARHWLPFQRGLRAEHQLRRSPRKLVPPTDLPRPNELDDGRDRT